VTIFHATPFPPTILPLRPTSPLFFFHLPPDCAPIAHRQVCRPPRHVDGDDRKFCGVSFFFFATAFQSFFFQLLFLPWFCFFFSNPPSFEAVVWLYLSFPPHPGLFLPPSGISALYQAHCSECESTVLFPPSTLTFLRSPSDYSFFPAFTSFFFCPPSIEFFHVPFPLHSAIEPSVRFFFSPADQKRRSLLAVSRTVYGPCSALFRSSPPHLSIMSRHRQPPVKKIPPHVELFTASFFPYPLCFATPPSPLLIFLGHHNQRPP